jgi:hypothetical protein
MKSILGMNQNGVLSLSARIREALGLRRDDALIAETATQEMPPRRAADIGIETYPPQPFRELDEADTEQARFLSRKKKRPR